MRNRLKNNSSLLSRKKPWNRSWLTRTILFFSLLFIGCGGQEDECFGPVGKYSGEYVVEVNNCPADLVLNWMLFAGAPTLEVKESWKCGEHLTDSVSSLLHLGYSEPIQCLVAMQKYLIVKEDSYSGHLLVKYKCDPPYGECVLFMVAGFKEIGR